MLRLLLIGQGKWGKNYVKAAEDSGLGKIAAVLTATHLDSFAKHATPPPIQSNPLFQEPREVITSLDLTMIDAAIVATHPPATEKYAIELLKRGVHVMAEKPFTFSEDAVAEVEKILEANTHLVFLINHQHLFSHAVHYLRRRISSTAISYFKAESGSYGPHRSYPPSLDYGPHDLSLLCYLTSERIELTRHSVTNDATGLHEHLQVTTQKGLTAVFRFWNNRLPKTHRVEIRTQSFGAVYDDLDESKRITIDQRIPSLSYEPPLTLSVRSFLKAIKEKRKEFDIRYGVNLLNLYFPSIKPIIDAV
jgi:predicted dehydrogenase